MVTEDLYANFSTNWVAFGNFNQIENSLYTSFTPLLFNIAIVLITLPALTERKLIIKVPLSFRVLLQSDFWRPLYKLYMPAYILHYMVSFVFYSTTLENTFVTQMQIV